jgi:CBS domain-containing protein
MRCPSCGYDNADGLLACEICHDPLTLSVGGGCEGDGELAESVRVDPLATLNPVPAVTVPPTTTVAEAVRLLAEKNIGCLLVVWSDTLLGIFSERDVLMRIGTRYEELAGQPIRHFMTPAPETLTPEDSIAFALNRMDVNDFRHIPIERNEQVVGIISVRDVLAYVTQQFPELAAQTN